MQKAVTEAIRAEGRGLMAHFHPGGGEGLARVSHVAGTSRSPALLGA